MQKTASEKVAVMVDSDEDVDMDDDTVLVGNPSPPVKTAPSDAGFTDFDDFGGFQANDSPRDSPGKSPHDSSSEPAVSSPDSQHWNAFSDPTDAGEGCQNLYSETDHKKFQNGYGAWLRPVRMPLMYNKKTKYKAMQHSNTFPPSDCQLLVHLTLP